MDFRKNIIGNGGSKGSKQKNIRLRHDTERCWSETSVANKKGAPPAQTAALSNPPTRHVLTLTLLLQILCPSFTRLML